MRAHGDANNMPLCPVAADFVQRENPDEHFWQFEQRHHPRIHRDVIFQETTTGIAMEPGDVDELPVYAIFQLAETRELLALVQWDYRD